MTKVEYSDFYRFLASLGIVLISLALLLPWLFLREPFDATITTSQLSGLTTTSQALINTRQTTALWFLRNIIWISGILTGIGFGLLIFGVVLWSKKQRFIDDKEHLEAEKLKREIESMTPTQIAEKVIKETEAEIQAEVPAPPTDKPYQRYVPTALQDYLRIEAIVVRKLVTCFGRNRVLDNQRVGDRGYDVILLPAQAPLQDVIIEIKVVKNPASLVRTRIENTIHHLLQGLTLYRFTANLNATGMLLYVLLEELAADQDRFALYRDLAKEFIQGFPQAIGVHFVTEEQLNDLKCDDLKTMVYPQR